MNNIIKYWLNWGWVCRRQEEDEEKEEDEQKKAEKSIFEIVFKIDSTQIITYYILAILYDC